MKYVVLIGDGMGDYPLEELGGKTPLQAASTPAMDFLAREGELGLVKTVPPGFEPGSDVANLSILGYDPASCYTGRGPLEAGSMGITLSPDDVAFRCNLVTLDFMADGRVVMVDYSGGHISTEEARVMVADIGREVKVNGLTLYPGVSYRHLLVWAEGKEKLATVPPHDYTGKDVTAHWGVYQHDPNLINWIAQVLIILRDHPVNERRVKEGKKPANAVWLWGQGRMPSMPKFAERFGIKGAIISAVDLLKGIGVYAGLEPITVPGATGYLDTNYQGKAEYALAALKEKDLVVVHVEAPDEASHGGNLEEKIKAIENFDRKVVQVVVDGLTEFGEHRV
ncbi:MAG: cofactor-independent phosphoglycerate mutase, partial [Deltaproteobacteria bacterium]|nr:cofactor-independent phosphoglycerate mutase [Deltaproteobacteria bacterium]